MTSNDTMVDVVAQIMATGTMHFAAHRDEIQRRIASDPEASHTPFYHAFLDEAREYVKTRADLIESIAHCCSCDEFHCNPDGSCRE